MQKISLFPTFLCSIIYTLIPVTTVQLGEPVTFTCVLPKSDLSRRVHWYKQSAGDTLKFIWALKEPATPEFAPEFSDSRWKVNYNKNVTNLTILRTNQEDEGIYHCGITQWLTNTNWTGTYLLRTNYTVVQEKTVPPAGSVTLQCSVLSDSDNRTCPGGLRVFWFREESHTSHPGIIYTDGNRHHECKKRSGTEQSCVYRFSKSISSSDEGTYYCAVATCGQIMFGNGTKLDIKGICFTNLLFRKSVKLSVRLCSHNQHILFQRLFTRIKSSKLTFRGAKRTSLTM
uniref:Ig-like domain-containing protein n=1 Tax=Amphilophus citrinellus TaxID=61819 RepID=A0A3Q0QV90_AMPCI